MDILAFEADQAFKDAKADPVAIRDRVLPNLIRCGRGREVIAPFGAIWDKLQPWFWQREQREREIIAIARSSTFGLRNTKVMDWWKGRWRSLDDAHGRLSAMARLLGEDIGGVATQEFQNRQRSLRNFLLAFANEPKRAKSKGITSARRRYCPSMSSDRRSARTRRSTRWQTCLPFGGTCGSPMNISERPGRNSNGA